MNRPTFHAFAAVLAVLVTGCASKLGAIQKFGKASAAVSEEANAAYTYFDNQYVDARTTTIWLTKHRTPTLEETTSPLATDDTLQTRRLLLDALAGYAKSLEELASKDFSTDVATATTAIDTNLSAMVTDARALNKNIALPPGTSGILSETIRLGANAYNEWQRERAIRKLVPQVDPVVQRVAEILPEEMNLLGAHLHDRMETAYTAFGVAINQSELPVLQALPYQSQARQYAAEINKVRPYYKKVGDAAKKIGETHAAIRSAVEKNEFSSSQVNANISELRDYVEQLEKYFRDMNAQNPG